MAMSGIFEPFKRYVVNQLKLRKQVISNPELEKWNVTSAEVDGETTFYGTTGVNDFEKEGHYERMLKNIMILRRMKLIQNQIEFYMKII